VSLHVTSKTALLPEADATLRASEGTFISVCTHVCRQQWSLVKRLRTHLQHQSSMIKSMIHNHHIFKIWHGATRSHPPFTHPPPPTPPPPSQFWVLLEGIRQDTLCMLISVGFYNLVISAQWLQDLYIRAWCSECIHTLDLILLSYLKDVRVISPKYSNWAPHMTERK
jgi:hypothetical protein